MTKKRGLEHRNLSRELAEELRRAPSEVLAKHLERILEAILGLLKDGTARGPSGPEGGSAAPGPPSQKGSGPVAPPRSEWSEGPAEPPSTGEGTLPASGPPPGDSHSQGESEASSTRLRAENERLKQRVRQLETERDAYRRKLYALAREQVREENWQRLVQEDFSVSSAEVAALLEQLERQ